MYLDFFCESKTQSTSLITLDDVVSQRHKFDRSFPWETQIVLFFDFPIPCPSRKIVRFLLAATDESNCVESQSTNR